MRIATYYPWIYVKGGVERTILELTTRSRHDWTVFTGHYDPEGSFPELQDVPINIMSELSVRRDVGSVARGCAALLRRSYDWADYDALVVHCDGVGNLLTLRSSGAPIICLCHTPLKVAYDPRGRERWREFSRPGFATRASVALFKKIDRLTWPKYQRVFCVSQEVRSRLLTADVVQPDRMEVLHTGVDLDRFVPSSTSEPYFLLPGRIMWSKNIELGLRAFFEFKRRAKPCIAGRFRLVVAGAVDDKSRSYLTGLRDLAAGHDNVEFITDTTDDSLVDLYARCYAVLFTPPNEDWGLVPLEAMASEKPVIAVGRGGPAESILDGETGILCDDDSSAFAEAMLDLAVDGSLHQRLSANARHRAEQFGWNAFVERIDSYLDDLPSPSRRRQAAHVG